ncbi:putative receptor-type adenylate cyclase, partial [Trypanosoma grayi]|uniref:putative receptor-type adenylate cyclase n=1 Tax=Trypanosoma grayi TaxID=71804 RepID=UPI0004F3F912
MRTALESTTAAPHDPAAGHRHPRLQLCAVLLSLVALLSASRGGAADGTTRTVNILYIGTSDSWSDTRMGKAAGMGFVASLRSRNFIVADGATVNVTKVVVESSAINATIFHVLSEIPDILFVLGPTDDEPLMKALPALKKHKLVSFAPITGSSQVRGWNSSLYFLRPEPAAELLALIRFAVTHLRVHRLGFMYLQGIFFGDTEFNEAKRVLLQIGYKLCGVFTLNGSYTGSADDAVFNAEWEKFADTRPQAVIVFGARVNDTIKFIKKMLTDPRTADAFLLGPFALQDILLSTWREAVSAGGVPFVSGQVITTGVSPLASDTQYEAIKRF